MEVCPLLSVILCTYNDERYIAETIKSVLAQSFCDYEFIIWNDGSTDSTEQIVQSFSDNRIRYYYHENVGLGKALQLACEQANGVYIARIDGDDICLPARFKKEIDFLKSNPDYVLVSGQMQYIDEDGKSIGSTFICTPDFIVRRRLPHSSTICHPASMFRKSAYAQCGGYDALRFMEDHVFFQRLLKYGKVRILPDVLIKYRVRNGSLTQSSIDNPYSRILADYRSKMVQDNNVVPEDVELYNQLFLLGRNSNSNSATQPLIGVSGFQLRVFRVMSCFWGPYLSRTIIIAIKNVIYYILIVFGFL